MEVASGQWTPKPPEEKKQSHKVASGHGAQKLRRRRKGSVRMLNDNDNDTLKEVPHPSNEGLALQARVSGPWPHKKESVLLVELARWQGVQTQTVNGQIAMQQVLR